MSASAPIQSNDGPALLVVEDDRGVRESLEVVLQVQGYDVSGVETGEEALRTLVDRTASDAPIDLIILDINLPGIDGVETCRKLRSNGHGGPVLMLTARQEVADKVKGLDAGADDYLPKPFALDELLARVRALLRAFAVESGGVQNGQMVLGDLMLDQSTRQASRDGNHIELTKIEFDLLALLVENENRVLSRDDIMMEIWGYEEDVASNTLEVFISGVRKKLEANGGERLIHTKRGVGYMARVPR